MLQTVAWGRMLANYTAERGFVQGVEDTFDGDHPCPMCVKIWANHDREQREKKSDRSMIEQTIKLYPASDWHFTLSFPIPSDGPKNTFAGPHHMKSQWAAAPVAPPPRA